MLNFNENKITNIFTPITLIFILYMPNYLSFTCVPVPITYKVYFLPVPFFYYEKNLINNFYFPAPESRFASEFQIRI
jgi:hypothetical protein